MKYFYDTEFIEHKQKRSFLGFYVGNTKPTIDLISIGIVSEDGREYYSVSKDFNLKEAWNRYDIKTEQVSGDMRNIFPKGKKTKVFWVRENVLMPIFFELAEREFHNIHFKDEWTYEGKVVDLEVFKSNNKWTSNFTWFKKLIKKFGKTNKQISEEIIDFCAAKKNIFETDGLGQAVEARLEDNPIKLYGYYSAYDHVVLCWLFGKMIDLPKGFPMYTRDLKQSFDEKQAEWINKTERQRTKIALKNKDFSVEIDLKKSSNYPKQDNEHNALDDAKWIKELYKFLETIN